MIDGALFNFFDGLCNILESIINIFPDIQENVVMLPEGFGEYVYWIGNIVDVDALAILIMTIVTYEIAMISVRITLFIWRLLPFT